MSYLVGSGCVKVAASAEKFLQQQHFKIARGNEWTLISMINKVASAEDRTFQRPNSLVASNSHFWGLVEVQNQPHNLVLTLLLFFQSITVFFNLWMGFVGQLCWTISSEPWFSVTQRNSVWCQFLMCSTFFFLVISSGSSYGDGFSSMEW